MFIKRVQDLIAYPFRAVDTVYQGIRAVEKSTLRVWEKEFANATDQTIP